MHGKRGREESYKAKSGEELDESISVRNANTLCMASVVRMSLFIRNNLAMPA